MTTFITREVQDALGPFVSDDEFFRLNPYIDLRIRSWRNEDEDRVTGSPGSKYECFWIVGAWRDGTISYTQFPFAVGENRRNRRAWFKRFERNFYSWILLITTSPCFRKGMQ